MKYLLTFLVFFTLGCATHSWCYKEMEKQCDTLPQELAAKVGTGLSADEMANMAKHLHKSCLSQLDAMSGELDRMCPKK